MEVYEYEKDVLYGYSDTKKKTGGRSSVAKKEDKIINREKVLSRARRDLRRIINANIEKHSKFLTLTFKDNITDLDFANNEFKKFIKRINYHYKVKVKYSVVIEFQKRGAIHYHALLYNLTDKLDIDKLSSIWGNGFIKVNSIKDVDNVGAYVCKYMTKTDDERLLGRKMYFNSRNLNKPKEIKESSVVEALVGSLQKNSLTYMNTFKNEYNSINYKQYIIQE
ncbi:rolling circle replication-associated protein [Clostridium perfringens]|uniref:rolling circle replication-associated protein n=1 Tax=Clostridium perfringens TaxID=1502 RepID=UPI003CC81F3B